MFCILVITDDSKRFSITLYLEHMSIALYAQYDSSTLRSYKITLLRYATTRILEIDKFSITFSARIHSNHRYILKKNIKLD